MRNKPAHSLEQTLAAVEKGVTVYGTAKVLGCHPDSIRRYARRWKAVDDALKDKRRELVDLAELGLRGAVIKQQPWAIAFALRTWLGRFMATGCKSSCSTAPNGSRCAP